MNLNVDEHLHDEFKIAVTNERKNMTDVLIDFMRRYVAEHGRPALKKKAKQ